MYYRTLEWVRTNKSMANQYFQHFDGILLDLDLLPL
jgi:hypothetical protein